MLPPRLQAVLTALARTIVPQAFGTSPAAADVMPLIVARLAGAPEPIRRDFVLALRVLDSAPVRLLVSGTWRAWAAMDEGERAAAFARWGSSRWAPARTVYEGIRRLVLSVYFGTPGAHADMGILPPLHQRQPIVPWEGPLGTDGGDETGVVTRGPRIIPVGRGQPLSASVSDAVTPGASLAGEFRLTADAVVIGSGAGGAVAAARLAEAGLEVVVLEAGSWLTAREFDENEARLTPRLYADAGLRATDDLGVTLYQGATAGGGTTVNWMLMLRTPEFVLEEWVRRFGLGDLAPAAMEPRFRQVEAAVHAGVVPDEAHSPANRMLLQGAQALGWRSRAAAINARNCLRAGTCSFGCRYDAKQSALLTWLPAAFAHGARLFTDVQATRIELLERQTTANRLPLKRVVARAVDPLTRQPGAELVIEAPVVVLAAGAIATPVLLQQSGMGGGAVGRHLRLHPTTMVMGEFEHDIYPMAGVPQTALCDEFMQRGAHEYGFWLECPAMPPTLASIARGGFGEVHRQRMVRLYRTVPIIALTRDGADLERSSGSVRIDRRGRRRIQYQVSESDRRTIARSVEAAARLLLAAGAKCAVTGHTTPLEIRSDSEAAQIARAGYGSNEIALFSAHVNGTCRMGGSPDTAAVTPDGERYGVRGLYVCDGSILPTAPGVNPQETIMALATMIADRIITR